jgi:hypothetical protein
MKKIRCLLVVLFTMSIQCGAPSFGSGASIDFSMLASCVGMSSVFGSFTGNAFSCLARIASG